MESNYFRQQKLTNLNPIVNGKAEWQVDPKTTIKKEQALARVAYDLQSGIIQQLTLLREKELDQIVRDKCYNNSALTFN